MWSCTGCSWAHGRSSSADIDAGRHVQEGADIVRPLDSQRGDRGQLQQQPASVVNDDDDAPSSPSRHQQMTESAARSPGMLRRVFTATK